MRTVGLILFVAACTGAPAQPALPIEVWETLASSGLHLSPRQATVVRGGTPIRIDTGIAFQEVDGFGASLTDSSAFLIWNHPERDRIMKSLFHPAEGIGVSFLRQPIGSSDYTATDVFTYDDVDPDAGDPDLSAFSIAHDDAYLIPLLKRALDLREGALTVVASAWTPPAWMKDNRKLSDGMLDPLAYDDYARYLVRFVSEYRSRGVPVDLITPVTEPVSFMKGRAPHLSMSREEQKVFVRDHLGPALAALDDPPRLLVFDDNFEFGHAAFSGYPEYLLDDPEVAQHASGTAGHCYFGQLDYMTRLRDLYPTKDSYVTECSNGIEDGRYHGRMIDALIDASRNWARGVALWNVALDERNGPYVDGCDGRCVPLVTISADGALMYRPDYFALGHFSKFVEPGARRVESTNSIQNIAFRNLDGSVVLVVHNASATLERISVTEGATTFGYELGPDAIATFRWR